jgi:RimJ/RimL family protein N-acetyltransferase
MLTAHAVKLYELFQDPELYPYITRTVPSDLVEFSKGVSFLEGRMSRDEKEYWLNWVSFSVESGEIIGKVEISIERENRVAYLAYTTFRRFWRQGYAKEACAEVIRHIFADWGADKVVIEMDIRNTASIRLAEGLGAKRVSFKPKAQLLKGEWSDEYRYELTKAKRRTP